MASAAARSTSGAPTQRRETGSQSARTLLLTVLGEFVLPSSSPAWTAALVQALGSLGVEEKAARQALARASAEGLLEPEKVGRRTRWHLTDAAVRLLEEGGRRIYGFMGEQPSWDGRWLVLAVTVPESQRQLRHRLRTRLTWAGMGSPAPGVWVLPYVERMPEIAGIVDELGIEERAMSWVGESGAIGRPEDVVAAAWGSLGEVEAQYDAFVARFARSRAPRRLEDAFTAQVELVEAWRRFPFIDPALPAQLLDHDWPGPRAAQVFHDCHGRLHEPAQQHWAALQAEAEL